VNGEGSCVLTIDVGLADDSGETGVAYAQISVLPVNTGRAVHAGVRLTLIDLMLAQFMVPSGRTQAREGVDAVHTGAEVLARRRGALVDVGLAQQTGIARTAHARERVHTIDAVQSAGRLAGSRRALIHCTERRGMSQRQSRGAARVRGAMRAAAEVYHLSRRIGP
jgi:hypothetical protein